MKKNTIKCWRTEAKSILSAQLKRKDVSHGELVELLAEIGITETRASVANKLSRGSFSAAFFLQVLEVLGVRIGL
ncbi:DUF6471 domain-containing protein [Pseudodesulfovibrio indicus]|uniref:DUF6471 domain-containing protein n=1 Tax=Pseudodesulfovibrio indicus TaxID=1716143 RepID=UPI00098FFEB5|nr:DUF6471 domain-containing protein [Pseudodesulfovibrio indicus]